MFKISAIIVSWNKKVLALDTIRAIADSRINGFELEIVAVDNGSDDGTPDAIKKYFESLNSKKHLSTKLIRNTDNLGFVEGNNIGMRHAIENGSKYVLLLNDDTYVDRDMLGILADFAQNHKDAGIVTPKIYFAPGYEFHKDRYSKKELGKVIWYAGGVIDWANMYGSNYGVDEVDTGQYAKVRKIDFASGCCMLIPATVLQQSGLFDERYFAYMEDLDLSLRIKNKGYELYCVPDAVMWHKVSQSSAIGSELNDYFITRNRLLVGMRYANMRTKFALLRESLKFFLKGRKWQKRGVRDYYLHNFAKGSWGEK